MKTATISTVSTVRQILHGMPKAEPLIRLMELRGADWANFWTLVHQDPKVEYLFSESIIALAQQAIAREIRARGRSLPDWKRDDIVQDLALHLVKATQKFDSTRGIPLIIFLRDFLRRSKDLLDKVFNQMDNEVLVSELKSRWCSEGWCLECWSDDDEEIDSPLDLIVDPRPSPEDQAIANDFEEWLIKKSVRGRRSQEAAKQQFRALLEGGGSKATRYKVRKNLQKACQEEGKQIVNLLQSAPVKRRCH